MFPGTSMLFYTSRNNNDDNNGFDEFIVPSDKDVRLHIATTHHPDDVLAPVLIFFLHGNGGCIEECWRYVIFTIKNTAQTCMPDNDVAVVATFDYRGYGRSSDSASSPENATSDAISVLKYLKSRFQPRKILLYGRSIGAAVAVHLSANLKESHFNIFLETPFLGTSSVQFGRILCSFFKERFECDNLLQNIIGNITCIIAQRDGIINSFMIREKLKGIKILEEVKYAGHNEVFMSELWITTFKDWVSTNVH